MLCAARKKMDNPAMCRGGRLIDRTSGNKFLDIKGFWVVLIEGRCEGRMKNERMKNERMKDIQSSTIRNHPGTLESPRNRNLRPAIIIASHRCHSRHHIHHHRRHHQTHHQYRYTHCFHYPIIIIVVKTMSRVLIQTQMITAQIKRVQNYCDFNLLNNDDGGVDGGDDDDDDDDDDCDGDDDVSTRA